jgi:hypothetical protein
MKYTTYYAAFVIFCLLFNSNLIAEEKGIHLRKDNSTEAPVNQLVIAQGRRYGLLARKWPSRLDKKGVF